MYNHMRIILIPLVVVLSTLFVAADDPTIQGEPREKSQEAMTTHIDQNSIDDQYIIYDAVEDQIRKLKFSR